ncbi:MAG: sialidase family protein [Acidobacteria bacterium]|nr:sialidase family protein [Acidobacteriota bacterium]
MPRPLTYAVLLALLSTAVISAAALNPELALEPPPIVTQPGAEYADANRPWQGIPGIERSSGGRLWATWYSGGTGEGPVNYVVLAHSEDNGETWSGPALVVDPTDPVRAYDPAIWTDPRGSLWLFWAQSAGLWDGRGGVWAIMSENPDSPQPTWSKPRRIADGVMMNKPTALAKGEWLLPISGWRFKPPSIEEGLAKMGHELPKEAAKAFARSLGERNGSMVYASKDQGQTFEYRGQALVEHPQHDEHMVVERNDGSIWMLIRTTYGIGESISRDRGASWNAGGDTGIPHPVTRFHIRRLRSGRLLLVRNVVDAANTKLRTDLTAFLSGDDGRSWTGGLLLDGRESVSYPDAVEAEDGTLYVIYDRERGGAKEVLLARVREEDILARTLVSRGSRLRLLVNKATGKK